MFTRPWIVDCASVSILGKGETKKATKAEADKTKKECESGYAEPNSVPT
jgi:hypothetical protein